MFHAVSRLDSNW